MSNRKFLMLVVTVVTVCALTFNFCHLWDSKKLISYKDTKGKRSLALGLILDTAKVEKCTKESDIISQVPFFTTLLSSLCKTVCTCAKHGFQQYSIYMAVPVKSPGFESKHSLFESAFKTVTSDITICPVTIELSYRFVKTGNYGGSKELTISDIMIEAFLDNYDYFWHVDENLQIFTEDWAVQLAAPLEKSPVQNLGVVFPHFVPDQTDLMYPFVHRTHFDIFGLLYTYETRDGNGISWLSNIYKNNLFKPAVNVKYEKQTTSKPKNPLPDIVIKRGIESINKYVKNRNTATLSPKRIISLSLFGGSLKYAFGAIRNAQLTHLYYPGWTTRVYVSDGTKYDKVPDRILHHLKRLGAEIQVLGSDILTKLPPMMWRFLAADDTTSEIFIVRDTDSRLTEREAKLVNEWVNVNPKIPFHCIRDHPSHGNYALSGGMFGGRPAELITIFKKRWKDFMIGYSASYIQDMNFLNGKIWPQIHNRSICHDSVSCKKYPNTRPIVGERYNFEHIGEVYDHYDQGRQGDINILKNAKVNQECVKNKN